MKDKFKAKYQCKICKCYFEHKIAHGCLNKKADWKKLK
jgi:hypothetical protein